ncbi:high mobility group box domain-containing protein, partial [Sporodiniella umbellata]
MANSSKILRPMNSFMLYRLEKQQEIVKQCPGANHCDISKIIAKWWKEMSNEEKAPYREKAALLKDEHRKLHPEYKFSPK